MEPRHLLPCTLAHTNPESTVAPQLLLGGKPEWRLDECTESVCSYLANAGDALESDNLWGSVPQIHHRRKGGLHHCGCMIQIRVVEIKDASPLIGRSLIQNVLVLSPVKDAGSRSISHARLRIFRFELIFYLSQLFLVL